MRDRRPTTPPSAGGQSRRRALAGLAALVALLASIPAHGLTDPIPGAVPFPTSTRLVLPFPAGSRIAVISGYSPSGGSTLHADTDNCCKANDYYALDLNYADEAMGGLGMPLLAPLPGTVVKAGWATAGWANYGQRVILRHDLGDGHVYHTMYAHMNAIAPGITEGATVAAGQQIGELGRSCMGALSCSSFSTPHLHWCIHRDSMVGGSGTGGSYGGNAVVPEPLDGAENLMRGMVITSTNTGMPECGDGYCNGDETPDTCPGDCPRCDPVPPAGRAVDETEICFERGGNPTYWNSESVGYMDSLIWTHTTDAATVDNFGIWHLDFAEAGRYRLEVFTDARFAQAQQARYQVRHGGSDDGFTVDQSAADGFQMVADLDFAAGGDQQVRLDDNTGEPFSLRRQIVFDAVRLTRLDAPAGDAGPGADSGTPGTDAAMPGTDGGTPPLDDGGLPYDGAVGGDGGRPSGVDSGCGCEVEVAQAPAASLLPVLLVVLGLLVRRRRR